MNTKYAVCWIGYKPRPFLEKCLKSIAGNKKYDTYGFIDNCGEKDKTREVESLFKKYFPEAELTVRECNYGLDLNVVTAIDTVFSKGYEGIFYCEDDIYFDSNAFETLENLAEWASVNVPEAGVFHSWNYNLKQEDWPDQYAFYFKNHGLEKLNYNDSCSFAENEVGFTGQNHWGALITRRVWETCFQNIIRHYISYINAHELSQAHFDFQNFLELVSKIQLVKNVSDEFKYRTILRFNIKGWEAIYETALISNGILRLALTTPRSMCIENEGTDFSSQAFQMLGLDKIKTLNSENVPKEFILNKKSKELFTRPVPRNGMKVALVCIACNEEHYIREWINYHKLLGVDDIFIYQNNWRFPYENNDPSLHLIEWDGSVKQLAAYNDFKDNYYKEFDFGIFIDCDEFVCLKKHNNIKEFLREYVNFCGVGLNWKNFGDSHLDFNGDYSIISRFTLAEKGWHREIKTIVNFSKIGNHFKFVHPHHIDLQNAIVDVTKTYYINGPYNILEENDIAQLNHYRKTRTEFYDRRKIGFPDTVLMPEQIENQKLLFDYEFPMFNAEEDLSIQNWLKAHFPDLNLKDLSNKKIFIKN